MKYLFNSVTEFISPEIISSVSKSSGEDGTRLTSAIQTSIASLLEVLVEKGENKKLDMILKGMGSSNTLLNISDLFRGEVSSQKQRINSKFLNYLLKDKVSDFISIIASSAKISEKNAKDVVFKVSALVSAFLGEKLISRISFSNILEQLEDERNDFQMYIPLEMGQIVEKSTSKAFLSQKLWLSLF